MKFRGRGGGGGGGGLELGSRLSWRDDSVMGSSQPKSQEVVQKKS